MIINVDLTDNEARLLTALLNSQDFDAFGFESDEEVDDITSACNKITDAIDMH